MTDAPGNGIAFFDFDNTLIDGDAGPLFGWYLFLWRRHELEGHRWKRLRLWLRYVPFATWMGIEAAFYKLGAVRRSTLVRASYKGLRGVPSKDFYPLMHDFASEILVPRLYPDMAGVVRTHLAAGRRVVVVTTGMEALVRHVIDAIDPRIELIGCRLRERNGKLSGRVDGPLFGLDKANILHAFARAAGQRSGDCWAYSDHWSDKHMLEAVGHPVAVNPRGKFRRRARKAGWQVLEVSMPPTSQPASA
ncbi:MAG: HAD-IB family phosphatase [bacterium]